MQNFGKYLVNLSDCETQIQTAMAYVSLVLQENFGGTWTADMVLEGSIKQPNTMKGIITFSVADAISTVLVNKPSTKKKSKKGTAKERGTNSSLKAVKSVKGVRSKSR